MTKNMLIDASHPEEIRVAVTENNRVQDFDIATAQRKLIKGNIYLAKITRVEPSLQAAFVEYGGNRQGFLPFSEIHPDYYQIPIADRERLLQEERQEEEAAEKEEMIQEAAEAAAHLAADVQEHIQEEHAIIPRIDELTSEAAQEGSEDLEPKEANGVEVSEPEEAGVVETLASEEETVRPQRRQRFRRYKIQEVIKRGQVILVQVIKEERGTKGASLSSYISLAGRYCVLMPNSQKDGGVSRKIASNDDRRRLKQLAEDFKLASSMSIIIRTAGLDRTRTEIKRDYDYLVRVWNTIREQTLSSTAPALVYEESDIIKRALRDLYTSDMDGVVVEGEEGYRTAKDFMKMIMPSHAAKIQHYKEEVPLFHAYSIEDQLANMNEPVVHLPSGGYLVLGTTEALVAIDVNSGRSTGERNIEETATRTNLEAAQEVARQLRLRDLAGLIVIDFIDMLESRNRRAVEKALKEALRADRAKIQLGRISPFGLLEMSRQRLRPSITETSSTPCPLCNGKGLVRSPDSVAMQIIRELERAIAGQNYAELRVIASHDIALYLLNEKREALLAIEKHHNIRVRVEQTAVIIPGGFKLEFLRPGGQNYEPIVHKDQSGGRGGRRRKKGGRMDSKHQPTREETPKQEESFEEEVEAEVEADPDEAPFFAESTEEKPADESRLRRRRGRRGGRGRRRWRDKEGENANANGEQAASGEEGGRRERHRHRNNRRPAENGDSRDTAPVQESRSEPKVQPLEPSFHSQVQHAMEHTSSGDNGSDDSKKRGGWWRRMIE